MSKPQVLVIDDNRNDRERLRTLLEGKYECVLAENGRVGLQILEDSPPDLILLDINLGGDGPDGFEVLKHIRGKYYHLPVVMVSVSYNPAEVRAALRGGANHFVTKTQGKEEFELALEQALRDLEKDREIAYHRSEYRRIFNDSGLIGSSEAMHRLKQQIQDAAAVDFGVLLTGEPGVGKTTIARAIHDSSSRRSGPFISVNITSIAPTLLESECFGSVRGAFSGAVNKEGYFEAANRGTICLDEIGEMELSLQPKLLQALRERTVRRVGEIRERHVDVRVIAATNKDLEAAVRDNRFRKDLMDRLNVCRIVVPPLRDRAVDIPEIALYILDDEKRKDPQFRRIEGFTREAMKCLTAYPWPSNIAELRNAIQSALSRSRGNLISEDDLEDKFKVTALPYDRAKEVSLERFESEYWTLISRLSGKKKTHAGELSGMSRQGIHKVLERRPDLRHLFEKE